MAFDIETLGAILAHQAESDASADTFIISNTESGSPVYITDASNMNLEEIDFYGESKQLQTTGKNQLNCNGLTTQISGGVIFTPVYKNGSLEYINAYGTNTTGNVLTYILNQAPLNDNEQYILNGCPNGGSGTTFKIDCFYSGEPAFDDIGNGVAFTARQGENLTFRIVIFGGATLNNVRFYPMLRRASITNTTYEPYTNGVASPSPDYLQPIESKIVNQVTVCGKNLFAFEKTAIDVTSDLRSLVDQRLIFTKIDDNTIKCNYNGGNYGTGYIELNGLDGTKDYSFSFDVTENTLGYTPRIEKYMDKCTSTKLVLMIYSGCGANNIDASNYFVLSNIQVEVGPNVTLYEPYKPVQVIDLPESIELNGIGDIRDSTKLKRFETVVFDGTEQWQWYKEMYPNLFMMPDLQIHANGLNAVLCTHYPYGIGDLLQGRDECRLKRGNPTATFYISSIKHSSVAEFKSWLAEQYANGTPVTLTYELSEPVETDMSQSNVKAIKSAQTYKPNTIVMNDANALMDVHYIADKKSYIDNKIEALATAILNK